MIENMPPELDELSSNTHVSDVSSIEVDTIEVDSTGVLVKGSGVVEVELEYDGGDNRDGLTLETDFPFDFDVVLDSELRLQDVHDIRVDTSSFYE